MLSKRLRILLVLALLPALQVPSKPVSSLTGMELFKLQHAPMKFHARRLDGSVESTNWSGFAVTGSRFTHASGSWIVPAVNCTRTPNSYAVFWVGIDGYADTTVEQIGTLAVCTGTAASYYAWYEFVPNEDIQLISSVAVAPSNEISADVTYDGSGEFTLKITNVTSGKSFSKRGTVDGGANRTSAEWIAEAPASSTGVLPLSDFGTASYGNDYTDVNDTNWATDIARTGPIGDFGTKEKIIMVTDTTPPVDKAVPSALSTDGSSFKVTWKHR
jgi:Peptidase A4 family